MEEEKEKSENPKISMAEAILIGLLLATVDFFEALSLIVSPVPVIGQVAAMLSVGIGVCVTALVQFYLAMRGIKALWFLASGLFPVRVFAWLLVTFFANNPRLKKLTDKAGGALPIKI
jgi:hypothetical protein